MTGLSEEIARVRYLVGNGFRLLLGSDEKTAATWKKITAQVNQRSGKIADDLLSRRQVLMTNQGWAINARTHRAGGHPYSRQGPRVGIQRLKLFYKSITADSLVTEMNPAAALPA